MEGDKDKWDTEPVRGVLGLAFLFGFLLEERWEREGEKGSWEKEWK